MKIEKLNSLKVSDLKFFIPYFLKSPKGDGFTLLIYKKNGSIYKWIVFSHNTKQIWTSHGENADWSDVHEQSNFHDIIKWMFEYDIKELKA